MKKIFYFLTISTFLALGAPAVRAADTYSLDAGHSTVGFVVKHLTVSEVRGEFSDYQGTIQFDAADPAAIAVDVVINVQGIDTRNPQRDDHLRSADFFDAPTHPTITFKSTGVTKGADTYTIAGDLTIRGVTKPVTLTGEIAGPVKGPSGGEVIGLAFKGKIDRQDFGVSWSKKLDLGGLVVGDEVTLDINVEAHKQ